MNSVPMRLGVNLDHIATLRQARGTRYPCPVQASTLAVMGGADQITVHLREDRRHIRDRDVYLLKEVLDVPLNLEMAATREMLNIALEVQPHTVTLVPEKDRSSQPRAASMWSPCKGNSKAPSSPSRKKGLKSVFLWKPMSSSSKPAKPYTSTRWSCTPAPIATRSLGGNRPSSNGSKTEASLRRVWDSKSSRATGSITETCKRLQPCLRSWS